MSTASRQRLVRRLDIVFFVGLLITSGLAALLLWTEFYDSEETEAVADQLSPTFTATATSASTATTTFTRMPTDTATAMPTETLTATPTNTPTDLPTATNTSTQTPTPTDMPSPTSSPTATRTPTFSPTPWPMPVVDPLALTSTYAGEPIAITGTAQPGDTIQVFDQDELIGSGVADANGEWEVAFPEGLSPGPHALSVVAVGPEGESSQPVPVGFVVAKAPTLTQTSTATRTPTRTQSPTFTATLTQTAMPTLTATPIPPTLTFTTAPTDTSVPPTLTATAAPLIQPTASATPLPPTATVTPTSTPSATLTPSPVPPSKTPIPPSPSPTLPPTETPVLATKTAQAVVESSTPEAVASSTQDIIEPVIHAPASGETYSPGSIPVRGSGPLGVTIEIRNQATGSILASVQVAADNLWQAEIELHDHGQVVLVAVVPDGDPLISDPVTITIAPPVQPNTGSSPNSDEAGRTFTALLALLLSAGGFSAYFAGRLLYLLAQDRMK